MTGAPAKDDDSLELMEGLIGDQSLNDFFGIGNPYVFLFRMSSDAMSGDGILKGDIIVCSRREPPADGKIIIMAVDRRFAIRRFVDGLEPKLVSSNPAFPDIVLSSAKYVDLFGVVTGVIRKGRSCFSSDDSKRT